MSTCILDGRVIESRERLHEILKARLELPDWYGRNLDALFDCLSDIREESRIVIRNRALLEHNLGSYAAALFRVLNQAAEENPQIHVTGEEAG